MRSLAVTAIILTLTHYGIGQRFRQEQGETDPCLAEDKLVPHPKYCDRYLECAGGQTYEVDCPNGLIFTGKKGLLDFCDYPYRHPRACLNKQLANPPISTEHCDWLYGIFGHETSCTRYWTCWNGTATEQFCIGGLLYNEQTHSCDWPEFVSDCQKHPLCVEDANGNVPLGKSCERYWSCLGGYPRLMRCPATLVFDKLSRRCVHPPTDDCDVPPTEAPVEEAKQPQVPARNRGRRPVTSQNKPRPRPIQPAPQALDDGPEQDIIYEYEDEFDAQQEQRVQADPAPAPAPARPAPSQGFRPFNSPGRPQNFRRPQGPVPQGGPAIPAGAIRVN